LADAQTCAAAVRPCDALRHRTPNLTGFAQNDPKGRKRDCAPRTFARRPAGQRH
jgi:hypothetical protein